MRLTGAILLLGGIAAPMLPVLLVRAPAIFSVPAIAYLAASLAIFRGSTRHQLERITS